MSCQTPYRDDSAQVLLFKIASCIESGGGVVVAGVSSFNGRTGVVTLTSGDVTTALGFTPLNTTTGDARYVLKSGDTMTGALTIGNGVLVANTPVLNLSQTWNNAAVAFTAFQSDVTATAAAAGSLLFNFRQNGVSVLDLRTDGRLTLTGRIAATTTSSIGHSVNTSDALNTAVVNVLTVGHTLSAGAGAAGLGARIDMVGDSATVASQTQLRIDSSWIDPVQATRTSSASFILPVSGTNVSLLTLTNNQAQLRDGTAALPSLTFQSDPDTGIYRIGANSLGISAGGVLRLTVDGTSTTSVGTVLIPDGTAALPGLAFSADTDVGVWRPGANILAFSTAGVERVRVSAIGLVGIGKTPGVTLDVLTTTDIQQALFHNSFANSTVGAGVVKISSPNNQASLGFGVNRGGGSLVLQNTDTTVDNYSSFAFMNGGGLIVTGITGIFGNAGATAGSLVFETRAVGGSLTERVRITSTGTVLMATAVPLAISSGANQRAGNAVLVAGTVTVANTTVTANTIIMLTRKTSGGTLGTAITYTVIAATSFTITSDSALDTSTFSYLLVEVP